MSEIVTPEFSRLISVERIPANGCEEMLTPKPDELKALAARFDLVDLPAMQANLTLKPEVRGTVAVTGQLTADVVQRCVVTLEPIAAHINVSVNVLFLPESLQTVAPESGDVDATEEDTEFYSGNKIDVGEWVAQHLGLSLDPYPRLPDATLPQTKFGVVDEKPHPFAKLASLAKPKKNKDKSQD